MPDYLHRTTKAYLDSRSPSDLIEPAANYIQDPDMSAVSGEPNKYWIITGDIVTLASTADQSVIDAAIFAAGVLSDKASEKAEFDGRRVLKALAELLVTEFNNHTTRTNSILNAIDSATNLATLKTSIGAIDNLPTRDFAQLRDAIMSNIDAGA